jgi:hypothetical protein
VCLCARERERERACVSVCECVCVCVCRRRLESLYKSRQSLYKSGESLYKRRPRTTRSWPTWRASTRCATSRFTKPPCLGAHNLPTAPRPTPSVRTPLQTRSRFTKPLHTRSRFTKQPCPEAHNLPARSAPRGTPLHPRGATLQKPAGSRFTKARGAARPQVMSPQATNAAPRLRRPLAGPKARVWVSKARVSMAPSD